MRRGARLALCALLLGGAGCTVLEPAQLTDAQEVIADLKVPPSPLKITAAANRADRSYHAGAAIELSVRVSKDAYVAVLQVLHSGETTVLFPNRYHSGAFVAAGETLKIPEPGAPYAVRAAQEGPQLFEFLASTDGKSWLFTRKPAKGQDFVALGSTTRGLKKYILEALKGKGGKAAAAVRSLVVQID